MTGSVRESLSRVQEMGRLQPDLFVFVGEPRRKQSEELFLLFGMLAGIPVFGDGVHAETALALQIHFAVANSIVYAPGDRHLASGRSRQRFQRSPEAASAGNPAARTAASRAGASPDWQHVPQLIDAGFFGHQQCRRLTNIRVACCGPAL